MGAHRSPKRHATRLSSAVRGSVTAIADAVPMRNANALASESEIRAVTRVVEDGIERRLEGDLDGDSDVFVVRQNPRALWSSASSRSAEAGVSNVASGKTAATNGVTLFVYGWNEVEPGPLSWEFPSLNAALHAAKTMRNATEWCIAEGRESSVDAARAKGAILYEQHS